MEIEFFFVYKLFPLVKYSGKNGTRMYRIVTLMASIEETTYILKLNVCRTICIVCTLYSQKLTQLNLMKISEIVFIEMSKKFRE